MFAFSIQGMFSMQILNHGHPSISIKDLREAGVVKQLRMSI